MLEAIMIARLHAMYQRSRIILIFLVVIFLVVYIACGVLVAIVFKYLVAGKFRFTWWFAEHSSLDRHQRR